MSPLRVADLRRDEGSNYLLETALLSVVALLVLTAPTQVWLVSHARNIAAGAAQVAAVSARGTTPSTTAHQAADHFLDGQRGLLQPQVSVSRGTQISVTVTGQAASLLPGVPMPPIRQTAVMPTERVTLP